MLIGIDDRRRTDLRQVPYKPLGPDGIKEGTGTRQGSQNRIKIVMQQGTTTIEGTLGIKMFTLIGMASGHLFAGTAGRDLLMIFAVMQVKWSEGAVSKKKHGKQQPWDTRSDRIQRDLLPHL